MLEVFPRVRQALVGREPELKAILSAMDARKHILLEGPPGTSKSTTLRNIAGESGIPFYVIEGNIDLTPAKLVGHFNPSKVMADNYRPEYFEKGPLTLAMEQGGILYIEEFNRMPADVANVLITPMEEGELTIPRYDTVKAAKGFIVIASQNPYDDVGTVRVSRAFMDRICLIKMDYQSEVEEIKIVKKETGCEFPNILEFAVKLVRQTRKHPEIKLGASVRAAIDMVDIFLSLEKLEPMIETNLKTAAIMAVSNKIWLSETSSQTPEAIIENLWNALRSNNILSLKLDTPKASKKTEAGETDNLSKQKEMPDGASVEKKKNP